ncbi:hypothetical protein D3C81_1828940 [compost metagenome]
MHVGREAVHRRHALARDAIHGAGIRGRLQHAPQFIRRLEPLDHVAALEQQRRQRIRAPVGHAGRHHMVRRDLGRDLLAVPALRDQALEPAHAHLVAAIANAQRLHALARVGLDQDLVDGRVEIVDFEPAHVVLGAIRAA